MRRSLCRKKGTTLVEIAVVLAVISIISTIVISFSLMVGRRVRVSRAKLEAMQDVKVIETIAEGWINVMRENGATFTVENNMLKAEIPSNDDPFTLSYDSAAKTLMGTLPGDRVPMTYISERVTSIGFDISPISPTENINPGASVLFFFHAEYSVPFMGDGSDKTFDYNFCVNPRVGHIINEVEGGQ